MSYKYTCAALLFFSLLSGEAKAQLETSADFRRTVYEDEFVVGAMFHTRGYGANFRRWYFMDGYNKQGYEIEFVNIRHPKEVKVFNQFDNSARGYVYGKLNEFYNLRLGYSRERIVVDKTDQGSVSISWILTGGLSLGLLKPVYLEVNRAESPNFPRVSVERYDPDEHNSEAIIGRANFFRGMGETRIHPGVYLKGGVSFDYNFFDDKVTALEVGTIFDLFYDKVPIMSATDNYQLFTQFYLTINFGKKWN